MKINPEGYFPQLPIKWQLIIGLSVLGFVIISIIGTATILFDMSRIDRRVEQASHHQTELVAKLALDSLIDKDRPTLQTMVDGLKDLDNGLVKIELSDQDGNILALWVDADTDEDLVSSSETIVYKGQEFGILSMAWTRDHFAKPILAAKTHSILTAFVAFGFLILSLGAVLQWYLVVPLQYLEKKVRAVADESAYTETMPSIIPRELRGLDESLDQTAQALVEKAQAESKVLDERSRAETAEAAAKARMDFLSLMSHEIRTPLGAMIGFGRLLKTAKLDAEERSILDNLNSSGRFLLRIINDILDLSKIEANGIQLEARPLNPVSVIVELEKMVQPLAQARGIGLEFSSSGLEGKQISADPHRLKQILMNLVGNAVKFTEDGTVTVSADAIGFGKNDQDEDTVTIRFEVSDTGIGMSAEQCSQIFDPFAQADSGITRRFGGTGLGLSIASQLAAKMDGAITVESEVNRGSTFRFEATFLVSEACDLELPKPEESEPDAYMADTSLRILIAEDETVNRILIEKIFASIGHEVEFVEDGQACFERLQQGIDFDALFLDLHMPHIGGFEIARKLRAGEFGEAGKKVNLVIMSADVLAEEEGQSIGVDAFISKPIDPSLLQSFLHSISADHSEIPIPPLPDDEFAVAVSKIGTARRENEMKVLVVEDQKLYRELMNQLLKRIGLDVSFAEDGIECLEFLEGEPDLDAIFLDLRMPRMGGKAVAKKIRDGDLGECYTDIPIAVVSAEELDDGDFEEIGANQFIAKPIDLELLKSFVERVRSDHSAVVLPG